MESTRRASGFRRTHGLAPRSDLSNAGAAVAITLDETVADGSAARHVPLVGQTASRRSHETRSAWGARFKFEP